MQLLTGEKRQAFLWWLRTGRLPTVRTAAGLELKFNPYHDPKDGRFTFGPGGTGSAVAYGEGQGPRMGRGGNSRAFEDPMTLEQAFPHLDDPFLQGIASIAQPALDIFGPGAEAQIQVLNAHAKKVLEDIKKLEPNFVHQEIVSPYPSVEAGAARLDDLMMWRAAIHLRKTGNLGPLKTAMLIRVQREMNKAYEDGIDLRKNGRLKSQGVNDEMKLGNYIDKEVRERIRSALDWYGIKAAANGRVRVNRRLYIDGHGGSYGIPDIRVGDTIVEGSLTRKTMSTPQLRRFAQGQSKPRYIAVVTPSGTHPQHTYIYKLP
jgi:hypothetical protein